MKTEYCELLKNPRWIEKRKIILTRDKNKCLCCESSWSLNVHHRQYHINKRTGNFIHPWLYDNKYLITLCRYCHSAGHSKFKVPIFKNLLSN